jgi:hypothetical protein
MQVHGVHVEGVGMVVVNSTVGNAGAIVDMINKEYRMADGKAPATLRMSAVEYNPKHEVVRDILDGVEGLTRVTPRKPVASVTPIKPARKVAASR